jgi:hypothetical protein
MGGACEGVCGTSVNECCMRTGKYEVLCVVCVRMDMLCIRNICMSIYECMCRMRVCGEVEVVGQTMRESSIFYYYT